MYQYKANIIRIIDGDTLVADLQLGFYITVQLILRLQGINTAELNSSDPLQRDLALKAKSFVEQKLILNKPISVIIETSKSDKYGRWLAKVIYAGSDNISHHLNEELINENLAKIYNP